MSRHRFDAMPPTMVNVDSIVVADEGAVLDGADVDDVVAMLLLK